MGEDYKEFMKEMQIEVSQKRITKLIEAKTTIKEVIIMIQLKNQNIKR